MGIWSFPEAKSGRGVTLTPHLLVPCPASTHLIGCTACAEPHCPCKGALYFLVVFESVKYFGGFPSTEKCVGVDYYEIIKKTTFQN
jgi:hypothetical protein